MSQFEKFKEKFKEVYPEKTEENRIWRFNEDFFDFNKNPLNAELKENKDEEMYDSFGNEDSTLERVFFFPKFDIFVAFYGTRASYEGEEWTSMKEVKPVTKTIETYE